MIRLGFALVATWLIGGLFFTITALSRSMFDPDGHYSDGLTRREMLGHRLAAAWLWPFYLLSKVGRQLLFYVFEDERGIEK